MEILRFRRPGRNLVIIFHRAKSRQPTRHHVSRRMVCQILALGYHGPIDLGTGPCPLPACGEGSGVGSRSQGTTPPLSGHPSGGGEILLRTALEMQTASQLPLPWRAAGLPPAKRGSARQRGRRPGWFHSVHPSPHAGRGRGWGHWATGRCTASRPKLLQRNLHTTCIMSH